MRSELRLNRALTALALAVAPLTACDTESPKAPAAPPVPEERISRTDSVKVAPKAAATPTAAPGASFCEKLYAPGEKPFKAPAERPLKGGVAPKAQVSGWTYLNLWATWCKPCIEEMEHLGRWRDALEKDGLPINLEMWTIDAEADEEKLRSRVSAGLPGNVHWMESEAAFAGLLESVGLEKTAAIPIHLLIDPAKNVRCVRVGVIHPEDYAQVKGVVSQR